MDTLLSPKEYSDLLRSQITEISLTSGVGQQFYHDYMTAYFDYMDTPLELWMFVAAINGKLMTRPDQNDEYYAIGDSEQQSAEYMADLRSYDNAEDNIIFDGFKVEDMDGSSNTKRITNGTIVTFVMDSTDNKWKLAYGLRTVGDMVGTKLRVDPTI